MADWRSVLKKVRRAGNILAKQLSFLANADSAGLVLGARVPIVLTSRTDIEWLPASAGRRRAEFTFVRQPHPSG
jgi:hypothetical protein